jgi:hypothetical protein
MALTLVTLSSTLCGCGGGALDTALEVKDAPRKPDGVLLEPPPAVPVAEEHGRPQEGVIALRQPVSDEQVAEVARDYIRSYTQGRGNISTILTDDAVLFDNTGHATPRPTIIQFVAGRYQQHPQDYHALQDDLVRADRLERWGHDDIGPHTDPPRPSEMRTGDIYARVPLEQRLSTAGDPLFHNMLVLLVRRGADRKLKIAGIAETDTP